METKLLNSETFHIVNLANATTRSCIQRISDKNNRNNGVTGENEKYVLKLSHVTSITGVIIHINTSRPATVQ